MSIPIFCLLGSVVNGTFVKTDCASVGPTSNNGVLLKSENTVSDLITFFNCNTKKAVYFDKLNDTNHEFNSLGS